MKTNRLYAAYRFFRTQVHGASYALSLARAERDAQAEGLFFEWQHEPYVDPKDWEDCDMPEEVLWCACRTEDGECLASLCDIGDPSRDYRRVVAAQLALEALHGILEREADAVLSL